MESYQEDTQPIRARGARRGRGGCIRRLLLLLLLLALLVGGLVVADTYGIELPFLEDAAPAAQRSLADMLANVADWAAAASTAVAPAQAPTAADDDGAASVAAPSATWTSPPTFTALPSTATWTPPPSATTLPPTATWTPPPSATPLPPSATWTPPPTATPPPPTATAVPPSPSPAADACYAGASAWTRSDMNVRERPATNAPLAAIAPAGEKYAVIESRQGEQFCWLRISLGWMAKTAYVSASEPPTAAPAPQEPAAAAPAAGDSGVQRALATLAQLTVAAENRCAPYDKDSQYPYPQSVEPQIIARMGGRVYGPYTGTIFNDRYETDIEHMVATSEAHDSGLCAASVQTRRNFARDLLNLTLAAPSVNRNQKSGKDFAEWQPARNVCWFADRVIQVKAKYGMTVDSREKAALESALRGCASVAMQ